MALLSKAIIYKAMTGYKSLRLCERGKLLHLSLFFMESGFTFHPVFTTSTDTEVRSPLLRALNKSRIDIFQCNKFMKYSQ